MKILLGNNTLSILAGSETWVYTLAIELKRLGHEITAYSPELGFLAAKLEAAGIKCVSSIQTAGNGQIRPFYPILEEEEDSDFDVIICNHYEITKYLHGVLPNVPIIATVHGILHYGQNGEIFPEHPVTEFKVDQYIAVSEEVQDKLKKEYGIDSIIIRNFFDLERFENKTNTYPKSPKIFFVNSNYWGKEDQINLVIKETSMIFGGQLRAVGYGFVSNGESIVNWDINKIIESSDVIFGMGRSVLEGACMGRLSVVHGRWGTGGVITPDSYEELKKTNFSGRKYGTNINNGKLATAEELADDIRKNFNFENSKAVYKLIKKNHDVKKAAQQFIEIAKIIIANKKV